MTGHGVGAARRRRAIHRLIVTAGLGAALGVAPSVASAGAAGTEPVDITVFNECTGEDVRITGTVRFVEKTRPPGESQLLVVTWPRMTAMGTVSGLRYVFQGPTTRSLSELSDDGDTAVFTTTDRTVLVTPGTTENFVFRSTYHFTLIDGEMVVEIDNTAGSCMG